MATYRIHNGAGAYLEADVTTVQNIVSNTSTITAKIYGGRTNKTYYSYTNAGTNLYVTIDGTVFTHLWKFNVGNWALGSRYLQGTWTKTVAHNADGSYRSFTVGLRCSGGLEAFGSFDKYSTAIAVPTIPRASNPTLAKNTFALEEYIKLTFNRKSTTFQHAVFVTWMNRTGWIGANGNPQGTKTLFGGDDITFYLPTDWASSLTDRTANGAYIDVYTYDAGGTQIGSTVRLKPQVSVPSSIVPTANAPTLTYQNALTGTVVQGITTATVQASGTGAYGSTIKSISATLDGRTFTGSSFLVPFTTAGTRRLTVTVTDSRGRTASAYRDIVVVAYTPPQIAMYKAERLSTETTVRNTFSASAASISGKNRITISVKYNIVGSATVTEVVHVTNSATLSYSSAILDVLNIAVTSQYDFVLTVKDLYRTATSTFKIGTTNKPINIHPNKKSVGIGKMASGKYALEVGGDIQFDGGIVPKRITVATDFDTLFAPNGIAFYYCTYGPIAQASPNCPTITAFSMVVYKHYGYMQVLTEYYNAKPKTYIRNNNPETGWGQWYTVEIESEPYAKVYPSLTNGLTNMETGSSFYYRDVARIVHLQINVNMDSTIPSSTKRLISLGVGWAPPQRIRFPMKVGSRIEYATIETNGEVKVWVEAGDTPIIGATSFSTGYR